MKVLIVSSSDKLGGAAIAANRLHKGLRSSEINSIMLVQNKASTDYTVRGPGTNTAKFLSQILPIINFLLMKIVKKKTAKTFYSTSWRPFCNFSKTVNELNPDLVHLHWINSEMLRLEEISRIKAPIVWTLHDMWPFTGGCHYNDDCENYLYNCGNCKFLRFSHAKDLSRRLWLRKKLTYSMSDITIVGLSRWIKECAKKSSLFRSNKIINLPNLIDTEIFKPIDKMFSRKLWNLPINKKLVLFGAMNSTDDPRKGYKELLYAIKHLKNDKLELVVFGSEQPAEVPNYGFKVHYVGNLSDEISLISLYNAVDAIIVPSLQENLSNIIIESLSCSLPVIAFDIGGNKDMIEHKVNGFLAQKISPQELANGVNWVLNSPKYAELCNNARNKVLKNFSKTIVTPKYIKLYKEILRNRSNNFNSY
jgi:glycosyltransferase involved in cell wall biosynthesis